MKKRLNVGIAIVIALLLLMVVMPGLVWVAGAQWSGSQTITLERHDEWITIYTSVLDYAVTPWWSVTGVVDAHPRKGVDVDISTTFYVPFWDVVYSTVGIWRGVYESETSLITYVSVIYHF